MELFLNHVFQKDSQNSFIKRSTLLLPKDGDKNRDDLLESEPRILQHKHLIVKRQRKSV